MEDGKVFILLPPYGMEIVQQCRSAFCGALEGKFGCTAQIHNVEDPSSFSHTKAAIVPEIKYSRQLPKNLKISVWKDDLTTHKADAVVNAANEHLSHGAGLALALCKAGGHMIQQWSDDIIKQKGKVPTGQVVDTLAGNLPCKMIIHAVGPYVPPNASKTELDKASDLLRKTIWAILQKAHYESLQSVAIPAISSGIFNFPLQKCAQNIVQTVKSFSEQLKPRSKSLEVRLVNNDDPTVQQMQKACNDILGKPDSMMMQNPSNAPTQSIISSLELGNVTLHLKKGAIEDETTDVIVNTTGTDLDLSKGQVSAALLRKAGWKIQDEIKTHGYGSEGDVIQTAGYYLNCQAVYHTLCAPKGYIGKANKILHLVVTKCLSMASSNRCSSISFPALGTGNLGLKKDEVSQIMITAAEEFSKTYQGSKIKILFVIFPKDSETLKAFEKEMASAKKRLQKFPVSSSTNGKSSGFHEGLDMESYIELFAPSHEALREAKQWSIDILCSQCESLKICNNHVVYLTQENHEKLMSLQVRFKVVITEFFKEGKGGIIINGENIGVKCAALEVEAMLLQAQEEFARSEENDMQGDLKHVYEAYDPGQIERMSNRSYQRTHIDLNSQEVKERLRNFTKCGLSIVKMEKIENDALKQLFELSSKRIHAKPRRLYQQVKAQFCKLICRVGFQREYAPPGEQNCGAGIYFTTEVDKAESLWMDNNEQYIYLIEALVLTGKEIHGSPELIVPPPTGKDPLVRYDSVTNNKGTYVIFNGQQAYPECLITCRKQVI